MDRKTATNSIFVFIFSFLSAVLLSSFFSIPNTFSFLILIIGVAILSLDRYLNKNFDKKVLLLSIVLIAFSFGSLRYFVKDNHQLVLPELSGTVVSEPEERENSTRFVLLSRNREKVLISTDLYSEVEYGDEVNVEGKLETPGIIDDGIGKPFDYAKYLSKDDIYYTVSFAKVEIISKGNGNPIKHLLFSLKESLVGQAREILPEPESSLLAGLVVAGKGAMPKNILEEFRRAGVIHIVVLSGYNITIIAEFMRKIFETVLVSMKSGVNPNLASGASIIGILLFVIMTGAEATVVRAALMVLVVIGAKVSRRTYSAPRALLVAAFLMVLHNPKILVFDPSFQLSFLATCGLIFFSPIVEKYLQWLPEKFGLRTMLSATLGTQLAVLPFLVYSVGDVSLVSLPANILVLLFIPPAMLLGFISIVISYVSTIIALPFSYLTHLLLAWILGVSSYLGNLSFASIIVPVFSFWLVLAIYLLIFIFLGPLRNSLERSSSLS